MKRLPIAASLLTLALLTATPVSGQASGVVLRPGDAVTLRVWPDGNGYSGQYFVGSNGLLALPYIGEIQASGVPVEELESTVRSGYQAEIRNAVVSMLPQFSVGVMGQVRSPSVYLVDPTMNLFDVVAQAGGFNPTADLKKVRIVRDREVIPVNALMSLETGVDLDRYRLRSGDQIIVPESGGIDMRTVFEIVRTVTTIILVVDRLNN